MPSSLSISDPRHPGYRPPFPPGNQLALRHGASTTRGVTLAVREEAKVLHAQLREDYPFIDEWDSLTVEQLVIAMVRVRRLDEYIWAVVDGEIEVVNNRGRKKAGWDAIAHLLDPLNRAQAFVTKTLQDLGMDPTGRYKLLKDAGWAKHLAGDQIGALTSEGARLRALRRPKDAS